LDPKGRKAFRDRKVLKVIKAIKVKPGRKAHKDRLDRRVLPDKQEEMVWQN